MRTPITYYGGKQTMLKHILPLIPTHDLYTEAFCGGARYSSPSGRLPPRSSTT